ncbi:helicase HerA-like domain-containing protein [Glutamicibacter arilaitensis]|uniref:helicase HerA-like domain-containing protein n=1 Tax=Glutamicibacter arilaitensis TaxID=256701 RepID=UPI00384F6AAE
MAESTSQEITAQLQAGYAFDGACLELGAAIVAGTPAPEAQVRVPLRMLNRHGIIAGATGTGKTVTLQVMAEQLSAQGVPVFLADIKGDLGGLAQQGEPSDKLNARLAGIGHEFTARANPVEFLNLGEGTDGISVRATIDSFGPILLARVLELNETQEECLQLVFHYADQRELPMDDLKDLKAVFNFLLSDEGKQDLERLGGVPAATASVILRGLTILQSQGLDKFFGQPEFDTDDFLRFDEAGNGIISCLELPSLNRQPLLFSTFMMWLLADLFDDLPEAGDLEKPKLVFFLDEAHLLFKDASKAFVNAIISTVRLIRSKGVGLFFVTQSPADLPDEVLGQLGNRIQHAVRVFTPKDGEALKAIIKTFPAGPLDLQQALTQAGVGEAVITVLNERGAPTPVAWTKLTSPGSHIGPPSPETLASLVKASELGPKYATAVDRHSAMEMLNGQPAAEDADVPAGARDSDSSDVQDVDAEARRIADSILGKPTSVPPSSQNPAGQPSVETSPPSSSRTNSPPTASAPPQRSNDSSNNQVNPLMDFAMDAAKMVGREMLRGMFGTKRRRSRR